MKANLVVAALAAISDGFGALAADFDPAPGAPPTAFAVKEESRAMTIMTTRGDAEERTAAGFLRDHQAATSANDDEEIITRRNVQRNVFRRERRECRRQCHLDIRRGCHLDEKECRQGCRVLPESTKRERRDCRVVCREDERICKEAFGPCRQACNVETTLPERAATDSV